MTPIRVVPGCRTLRLVGLIVVTVLFCLPTLAAPIPLEPPARDGQGEVWTKQQVEDARKAGNLFKPATELYRASEFSLDLFGTASLADYRSLNQAISDHQAGVGAGINYYFTRNIGMGASLSGHAKDMIQHFLNDGALSVKYRLPVGPVAFEVFGGGGYELRHRELYFNGHAGAGVEFRIHPNIGTFIDARRQWEARERYVVRSGFRISY